MGYEISCFSDCGRKKGKKKSKIEQKQKPQKTKNTIFLRLVDFCLFTGSAVRRLRYYSEGEESVGVSSLARGPLPDIVPVTHGHRERSLSAPDLESLQRQRVAAREVGRELRRISDEFLRSHEAMRGNPNGALVSRYGHAVFVPCTFRSRICINF